MKINRETVDLDFLLTHMKSEKDAIEDICKDIAKIPLNDGFTFNFFNIFLLSQPHMQYPGYRIKFKASFANMRDQIHIDIGVGDVVEPKHFHVPLFQYRGKPFFEGTLTLLAYPIESIFSEKLETLLSKGSANSRIKDYHDLLLLIREQSLIDHKKLKISASNTFKNRNTPIKLITFDEKGIHKLQQLWTAHILGLGDVTHELNFPDDIEQ